LKINIYKMENETKTSWKLTLEERRYDSCRKNREGGARNGRARNGCARNRGAAPAETTPRQWPEERGGIDGGRERDERVKRERDERVKREIRERHERETTQEMEVQHKGSRGCSGRKVWWQWLQRRENIVVAERRGEEEEKRGS